MKRILFVSEAVTLAQVVRLATLASSLDPLEYELHFAAASFDPLVFDRLRVIRHELHTLPAERVDAALAKGKRLYERRDLDDYVAADRELIERVDPALIVGDFRLSLCVSAPVSGVPLASLINAYWSPHALRDGFPLPEHPIVELLGVEMAARYFPIAVPRVFAHFAKPFDDLRKRHGLSPIGSLPDVLCFGDFVLHPDVPELTPTRNAPSTHLFLGHVPWAPALPLPELGDFDPDRPLVYVTLGSSGKRDRLPLIVEALSRMPVNVLVSTAGRELALPRAPNVRVAGYVPGDLAAERASLVITNGGASSAYQALAAGRPVLGIPYNLDQYLAMTAIEKTGAGALLRSGALERGAVERTAAELMGSDRARAAAQRIATAMAGYDSRARFAAFIETALASASGRARSSRDRLRTARARAED